MPRWYSTPIEGTNVQDRLHSIHRVDPPWTPAAWEQGNGRGKRNGNQHSVLDIYSYVARRTFDAFMFGTVERKSRGFEQLYRVDGQAREIEDVGGDGTLSFGELKAAAAGNDLLLRQHELATRVRGLRLAHITVQQNVRTLLQQADNAAAAAEAATARAGRLAEFAEHAADMAEIDMARVAAAVCPPRDAGPYRPPTRTGWTDHRVSIGVADTDAGPELVVAFNYRTLWAQAIPGKIRRRGPKAAANWAQTVVEAWFTGARDEIAATRQRAADLARAAAHARDAAAGVDAGEPPELITARAELEAVNEAISDALSQESPAAAA